MNSVIITIDGKKIKTTKGETLVDVANKNGIYIPTLCYMKDKPCLGTCRVCSVKVNDYLISSCTVPVADGMVVEVENDKEGADMRKALIELLFVEGNHNCPSCEKSGRCELQAVGYETNMMVSRFPYRFPVNERDYASDNIWLERDRCIFCQRCVEFIKDKETNQKIFSISNRGSKSRIEIDIDLADKMSLEQVAEAADMCPVGCIINKNQGFNKAIGKRKFEIETVRERALNTQKNSKTT
ncbi:2Fe-2S iron-sulfur cluster-binding protein [Lutibacter sp.]|uniref:2Fe-2S iron-sulfur cluster-binding protein n=1 Tax=Lutibacter sp. TaxID=1925666 RepID=UPI0025C36EFA|nr:2Fe-2S iron-sulfur cluster-binding protein [Lutibacter sp.]MCF6167127.1 2Fe-2S iron-sulfur cluster-binding protein [Lutibacter sp.]